MSRVVSHLIPLFVVFAILGWLLYPALAPVRGDITGAFAADVSDFVKAHHGALPTDWEQFVEWSKASRDHCRWTETELQKRFLIHISRVTNQANPPEYIRVLDPKLVRMQDYINRRVHNATNG
jgi:hypothetical protein